MYDIKVIAKIMYDIKVIAKIKDFDTSNENIQEYIGMEFHVEKCDMLIEACRRMETE